MRVALAVMIFVTALVGPMPGQAQAPKALTNADIVQMVKAGLPESTILLSIKSSPAEFDTAPTELIALKNAGVTQPVLDAMLTHGATELPPGAIIPSASTVSDYSAMVGPQGSGSGGFVAIDAGQRIPLQITSEDAFKSKRKFWHSEYVGIFSGSKADVRLSSRNPTFELPFPAGPTAEEAVRLMKMEVRGATREVSLRVLLYDPMLRRVPTVTDGVIETTLTAVPGAEASTSLLTPKAPLEPGEYAIIRTNTDVYDFGVD